jgi:hypothetical protein
MNNEASIRLYRAAWYATAGWCVPTTVYFFNNYDRLFNASPLDNFEFILTLSAISAGPLVLLTVGHWVVTGVWRFGWKG